MRRFLEKQHKTRPPIPRSSPDCDGENEDSTARYGRTRASWDVVRMDVRRRERTEARVSAATCVGNGSGEWFVGHVRGACWLRRLEAECCCLGFQSQLG
ncbi:hypothetical protein ES332_D03G052500v1 [Gossypium tomentosum]|uniref:Uncharacterized protein n=1 Tax=Gossypium tomentosum TaxID=34277 RepID=A0A5D2LL18_GOSTO|nr:hypothetical protein ES332_D03G052500v1 [Gossypium tomentosum]